MAYNQISKIKYENNERGVEIIDLDLALETMLERELKHFKKGLKKLPKGKILDKAYEMGSTTVVNRLKRYLHPSKIGHAGTLDPLATGVLPNALGQATKTIPYVMDGDKIYQFEVTWGKETSTDDLEGEVLFESEKQPSLEEIESILPLFKGEILQTPPLYSAIKINGKRAYELARKGGILRNGSVD